MDNADLAALLTPPRWVGRRCTVAQALEDIADKAKRGQVGAACGNPDVPGKAIQKAFMLLIEASPSVLTIRRHQTQSCNCPQTP